MTGVTTETWLACPRPEPDAARRLVCLPHAGGSAAAFRSWAGALPGVEVHTVRYPARAERIDEPPATDLRALAAAIAEAVRPLGDRPLALFGHSLGAAVALEVARALESGGTEVVHLFASGSRQGPVPEPSTLSEDAEGEIAQLVELGGMDPDLAADPRFRELVLPYVRSDGAMFRSYAMASEPLLRTRVTAIVGDADPHADQRPWADLTLGGFDQEVVPGDHFYLSVAPPFGVIGSRLGVDPAAPGDR